MITSFLQSDIPLVGDPSGGPPTRVANPSLVKPQEAANFIESVSATARVFDLSQKQDLIDYNTVIDAVAKGLAQLSSEEREFVAEKSNWVIFLRWQAIVKCPESAAREALRPVVDNWVQFTNRINTELKANVNQSSQPDPNLPYIDPTSS